MALMAPMGWQFGLHLHGHHSRVPLDRCPQKPIVLLEECGTLTEQTSLERPSMAETFKLRDSCRKDARHACRKVLPPIPVCPEVASTLQNSVPTIVQSYPRPKFDQHSPCWPNSARIWPTVSHICRSLTSIGQNVGQHRINNRTTWTNVGRIWPHGGRALPSVGKHRPSYANFVSAKATKARRRTSGEGLQAQTSKVP